MKVSSHSRLKMPENIASCFFSLATSALPGLAIAAMALFCFGITTTSRMTQAMTESSRAMWNWTSDL